ncbi:hypothetical protein EVAR_29027_1 [Eumeta japonica]|uniref:Uncharacterized protein n=1 Tax=Eumeta variegata TaxID=151549 RepID=A0A4C1W456_EUMVA|nr:hypothetical protein EVAR_29027_1 [Eumeta japonica]
MRRTNEKRMRRRNVCHVRARDRDVDAPALTNALKALFETNSAVTRVDVISVRSRCSERVVPDSLIVPAEATFRSLFILEGETGVRPAALTTCTNRVMMARLSLEARSD